MNTSINYAAQLLGTSNLDHLPSLVSKKSKPRPKPSPPEIEDQEEAIRSLDAEVAREHAQHRHGLEPEPHLEKQPRFPPIKTSGPRRSKASCAKDKYIDINTRSIRTLVTKQGAVVDLDQIEAEQLSLETGFRVVKIKELRKIYRAAVKQTAGLAQHSFKKVMKTFGLTDSELLGRIFEILDVSRSKRLSFKQFVDCIYLFMKGTRDQQAKVLFKMIDVSDDRSISKLEMLKFFAGSSPSRDEKKLVSSIVNEMMCLIDEDGSGEVTFDEFVNKVAYDEEVWECFQSISPLTQLIEAMHLNGV